MEEVGEMEQRDGTAFHINSVDNQSLLIFFHFLFKVQQRSRREREKRGKKEDREG